MEDMTAGTSSNKSKKGGEVDRVYGLLKDWILNCRFRPGDFLPELEVAAQCKTSRTPVREACNRLAEEKWLSKIHNRGYIISPISIQDIIEVYQYRKLLECFAAERAAKMITAAEVTALKEITAVEDEPDVNVSAIVRLNFEVHTYIGRLAQNERVYNQMILTLEYIHRLDVLSTQRNAEWVSHRKIVQALESHDPKAAHEAMAEHIDNSRDRMLRVFYRGELPDLDRR